jgi:hypothetical protein
MIAGRSPVNFGYLERTINKRGYVADVDNDSDMSLECRRQGHAPPNQ